MYGNMPYLIHCATIKAFACKLFAANDVLFDETFKWASRKGEDSPWSSLSLSAFWTIIRFALWFPSEFEIFEYSLVNYTLQLWRSSAHAGAGIFIFISFTRRFESNKIAIMYNEIGLQEFPDTNCIECLCLFLFKDLDNIKINNKETLFLNDASKIHLKFKCFSIPLDAVVFVCQHSVWSVLRAISKMKCVEKKTAKYRQKWHANVESGIIKQVFPSQPNKQLRASSQSRTNGNSYKAIFKWNFINFKSFRMIFPSSSQIGADLNPWLNVSHVFHLSPPLFSIFSQFSFNFVFYFSFFHNAKPRNWKRFSLHRCAFCSLKIVSFVGSITQKTDFYSCFLFAVAKLQLFRLTKKNDDVNENTLWNHNVWRNLIGELSRINMRRYASISSLSIELMN